LVGTMGVCVTVGAVDGEGYVGLCYCPFRARCEVEVIVEDEAARHADSSEPL
jgi:hypothetical protein